MCLAVPGKVLSIEGADPLLRTGRVDFAGVVKEVNLCCVPEAGVGSYVLVHVGLAISVIDEEEANVVFEYLREMGDLAEVVGPGAEQEDQLSAPRPPADPALEGLK